MENSMKIKFANNLFVPLAVILFVEVLPSAVQAAANDNSPLGMNLAPLAYWDASWTFNDHMKEASDWMEPPAWDVPSTAFSYDQNGWITDLNGQSEAVLHIPTYQGGNLVLLYDGTGDFKVDGESSRLPASGGSPAEVLIGNAAPNDYVNLYVYSLDAGDPFRNVRVYTESDGTRDAAGRFMPPSGTFNALFLQRLAPFKVIRFMDWMNINGDPLPCQTNWAQRVPETYFSYGTQNGPSLEVMIELADTLNANPWFNIHHQADDNYVQNFATMVRDRLNPGLKAYIEHSNEVWNGVFPQGDYAQQQGIALGLGPSSDWSTRLLYHSLRSVQIFKIFNQVFTGNAAVPSPRVVRVLGGWDAPGGGGGSPNDVIVNFQNAYQQADALAVAPYFGDDNTTLPSLFVDGSGQCASSSLDALATFLQQGIDELKPSIQSNATLCQSRGLDLVAYEAGQSLVAPGGTPVDSPINTCMDAANRDPRMKGFYTTYLNNWESFGGRLLNIFLYVGDYSQWGRWGVLETQDQPQAQAPKFDAIMTWLGSNPCWWDGCGAGSGGGPAAPTGLVPTAISSFSVTLGWTDNANNETGFKVERSTNTWATFTRAGTTGANVAAFKDSGLTAGTVYYYRVRSTNAAGDSGPSNFVKVRTYDAGVTSDTTPPGAPSNLSPASVSSTTVSLSWLDATDNAGVAKYRVFRNGVNVATATATDFTDAGLTPSTAYTYAVKAVDTSGNVGPAASLTVTTPAASTGTAWPPIEIRSGRGCPAHAMVISAVRVFKMQ